MLPFELHGGGGEGASAWTFGEHARFIYHPIAQHRALLAHIGTSLAHAISKGHPPHLSALEWTGRFPAMVLPSKHNAWCKMAITRHTVAE